VLISPVQGFFKGTSADQDRRFSDKELKLLKSIKFPPEFDKKVCHLRPCRSTTSLLFSLFSGGDEKSKFASHKTMDRQKGHRARWLRRRGRRRVRHGAARGPESHRKHHALFALAIIEFVRGRGTDPRPEKNANQPDWFPYGIYPSLYDSTLESVARGTGFTRRGPKDICRGKEGRNAQGKGERPTRVW
jgi:hypothetical protein